MANMRVVITKEFTFRGKPERFSNGYLFTGGTGDPASSAVPSAMALALINMEKSFHAPSVKFVYAYGGVQGADASYVEEFASPQVGIGTEAQMHPEVCVLAQAPIARRRYLAKYYHTLMDPPGSTATKHDEGPTTTRKTAIETQLAKLTDGTISAGWRACAPNGDLPTGPFTCDPWMRTHQLKARGKRPTAG